MSARVECNCDPDNNIQLLDSNVLKQCGVIFYDLYTRFKNIDVSAGNFNSSISITLFSADNTYMDLHMGRIFDRLYDMMYNYLENVDSSYRSKPRQLYEDLNSYMQNVQLHEINRHIFGNGSCQNWDSKTTNVLNIVKSWRKKFSDKTNVPGKLIKTYKMAVENKELNPDDLPMIAFAILCLLQGYDTKIDFDILFMYRITEVSWEPVTFQEVYNSVLRHVRTFLDVNATEEDLTYIDNLAENQDVIKMFNWIFDLLIREPETIEKFTRNPFSNDLDISLEMQKVNGRDILPSYTILLRIFYRWASHELFTLFTGKHDNRISMLDDHVKQLCLCCLSKNSWSQLFDDVYTLVFQEFTKILNEYHCPINSVFKTFRVTCGDEMFKDIIKLCIKDRVKCNSHLRHHDKSVDSIDSKPMEELSSSSCKVEEIE